ncbi:MAG: PIN domain-containing protein [Dehalococcoidia bacterium]
MPSYTVDTDFLVDIQRRFGPSVDLLRELERSEADLIISAVAFAEYYSGSRPGERPRMDRLLRQRRCIKLDRFPLHRGGYRLEARRRGRPLPLADCLIAATAVEFDAVLVTRNLRDFPMPGLETLSPS